MMPSVSVVIPTFNRSAHLRATLTAVGAQQGATDFEVIVVDDGSGPTEARRVRAAVESVGREVRLIATGSNEGPGAARNKGIAVARAELIAFLDDDCSPAPDWLERLTAPFEADASLGAVGGRVLPAPPTNWVSRFCASTEYSSGVQPVFDNAATANACYRSSVLATVSGFDESFGRWGGEDPDLSQRTRFAGFDLRFVPEAVVFHRELESFRDFLDHMFRRGLGEAHLARKQGRSSRVAARAVLAPVYLARAGVNCWFRTQGKGSFLQRALWVFLDTVGRSAFVTGSTLGLSRKT